MKDIEALKDMLHANNVSYNLDTYSRNVVWLTKKDEVGDYLICLMVVGDSIYVGCGDGYHRSFNSNESTKSDKVDFDCKFDFIQFETMIKALKGKV